MKSLLLICALAFNFAYAEVTSMTLAATVKSFNEKTVVCQSEGMTFTVKRSAIHQKTLHQGDAVLITLAGEDVPEFLKTGKPTAKPKAKTN